MLGVSLKIYQVSCNKYSFIILFQILERHFTAVIKTNTGDTFYSTKLDLNRFKIFLQSKYKFLTIIFK